MSVKQIPVDGGIIIRALQAAGYDIPVDCTVQLHSAPQQRVITLGTKTIGKRSHDKMTLRLIGVEDKPAEPIQEQASGEVAVPDNQN